MESEIILVGNELLIGKIQDINGQWIIKRLLEFGHRVARITIIADDVDIIAKTVRDALKRSPEFIFISGGLGPTWDDLTAEGISKAYDVKLVLNDEALNYIKNRFILRQHFITAVKYSSELFTDFSIPFSLICNNYYFSGFT